MTRETVAKSLSTEQETDTELRMIARGGGKWIGLALLVPVAVAALHSLEAAAVSVLLPVAVATFFRDPDREPDGEGVLSPADGKVTVLREEDGRVRLGIFMNLHDVHVNRAPVGGEVVESKHHEGGHRPAFSKESERNERVVTRIDEFVVAQIAGAFARRITPYIEEGDIVEHGERIGAIAFGSRVDVVFPSSYTQDNLAVEKGDRVRAGETVLAPNKDEQ